VVNRTAKCRSNEVESGEENTDLHDDAKRMGGCIHDDAKLMGEWESGEENIAVHHQMVLIKLYRAPRADKL